MLVEQHCVLIMRNEQCSMPQKSQPNVIKKDANIATTIRRQELRHARTSPSGLRDFPQFMFKRLNENSMERKKVSS